MKLSSLTKSVAIAAGLLTLGAGASVDPAQARNTTGSIGSAVVASDAGCFSHWGGGIFNTCSGNSRKFGFSLPVDTSGNKTVRITLSTNLVTCQSWGSSNIDTNQNLFDTSTLTVVGNGFSELVHTGVGVPTGGALIVECLVAPGGRIQQISW